MNRYRVRGVTPRRRAASCVDSQAMSVAMPASYLALRPFWGDVLPFHVLSWPMRARGRLGGAMTVREHGSATPVAERRSAPERAVVPPPRIIQRRPGLPGTRAVVGGLLMALAAIGVFLAYADASRGPSDPIVITRHAIRVGEVLEATDLRVVIVE